VEPADWVERNRSGLVSALIKATRMRKMNHALYFCALLLLGGQSKWYVSRRVCIMSCEDGLDDVLMKYISLSHALPDSEKSIQSIMNAVVAICLRPNWWGNDYGKQMMYGCLREEAVDLSAYATEEELVALMEESLFVVRGVPAWTVSSAAKRRLQEEFGWSLRDVHEWLLKRFAQRATELWQEDLIATFERVTPDITKFGDENWNYIARYMFAAGRNPDMWSMEQLKAEIGKREEVVAGIHQVAAEKLESGEVVIPPWAYDGVHASSKAHWGWADRRFPGTLEAFDNCLKMVASYGRLDPRDQGILGGCQVPEEGLVLGNDFLGTGYA
jgi:hypothetical protein